MNNFDKAILTSIALTLGGMSSGYTMQHEDIYDSLFKSCETGDLETVRNILTTQKINLNCYGSFGFTPLMFAALHGHLNIVIELMNAGFDVYASTQFGQDTALHLAAQEGYLKVVKFLVEQGKANIYAQNYDRHTPQQSARLNGHQNIATYLAQAEQERIPTYNEAV